MRKIISVLSLSLFSQLSFGQISEHSSPIRSNSYVQPFDIDLATKVMEKKNIIYKEQMEKKNSIYKERVSVLLNKVKYLNGLLDLFPEDEIPDKLLSDYKKLSDAINTADIMDYNSYLNISTFLDFLIKEAKNQLRSQMRR